MSIEEHPSPKLSADISLREVTRETAREIMRLDVTELQKQFVAPNSVSIGQAYFDREHAWFRAIYAGDVPVGFVMVYDNPDEEEYFLWRFMIDARYQGSGYGWRALELFADHIRARPGARYLFTSCVPAEGVAHDRLSIQAPRMQRVLSNAMERLYGEVEVGTPGELVYEPVKVAVTEERRVFLEADPDVYGKIRKPLDEAIDRMNDLHVSAGVDWVKIRRIVQEQTGIAEQVTLSSAPFARQRRSVAAGC